MVIRALMTLLPLLLLADGGDASEGGAESGDREPGDGGADRSAGESDASAELDALRRQGEEREQELVSAAERLTAAETELETLRTFVAEQIATAREELPEALLAFDPGEAAALEERLAWLNTAREQAAKVPREVKPGNGENPKPGGAAKREIPSPVPLRNMF